MPKCCILVVVSKYIRQKLLSACQHHARPGLAGYGLSCCASSLVPSLATFGLQSFSLRSAAFRSASWCKCRHHAARSCRQHYSKWATKNDIGAASVTTSCTIFTDFWFCLAEKAKNRGWRLVELVGNGRPVGRLWTTACGCPSGLSMGNREAVSAESGRAGLSTNPHA